MSRAARSARNVPGDRNAAGGVLPPVAALPMLLRPLALASALAFGTLALGMPMTASSQSATPAAYAIPADGTLLSVSASADATRVPDVATISTGVVSQAADANAAMRANAAQMDKVMAAIRAAGIAERDIQTSGINLNPQYHYQQNKAPRITGYEARNTVSVKLRDLGKLGKIMDTLVAQGANELNGPSFEVDKPDEAYDEARRAALEKAQARAEMYAKTLGLKVRRIVSIDEGSGGFRPPVMYGGIRAVAAEAKMETQVAPGESNLSVTLNIVFELGR